MTDPYHCRYCNQAEPVPSLIRDHEARCPLSNNAPDDAAPTNAKR